MRGLRAPDHAMQGMKDLLHRVIGSDDEMEVYLRLAWMALAEEPT
jgi:hypothetical protein